MPGNEGYSDCTHFSVFQSTPRRLRRRREILYHQGQIQRSQNQGREVWGIIDTFVPTEVGDTEVDEDFRGLSFSDEFIIVSQYDSDGDLSDLCRIQIAGGELHGACFDPTAEDSDIKCFSGEDFVEDDARASASCGDVYDVFSESESFTCRKRALDGQMALQCSDGYSVLAYEYETLCRVHTSSSTGRCIDADDSVGSFQETTWEGYSGTFLLDALESLSPAPLQNPPSEATLSYESLTPELCSIDENQGTLTAIAAGTCEVQLTVSAEDYSDKVLSFSLEVESDTFPSFAASANIADIAIGVEEALTARTLPEASGGNGDISYSITPDLPRGITFNRKTREILGTPRSTMEDTGFLYIATDDDGDIAEIRFHIMVSKGDQDFDWPASAYGDRATVTVGEEVVLLRRLNGGQGDLEFRSRNTDACTVSADGMTVTPLISGQVCRIDARWSGNDNWEETDWEQLLGAVVLIGSQQFSWPTNLYGPNPFLAVEEELSLVNPPTGGEGDPEYQSLTSSICTVDGSTGVVTGVAPGACEIQSRWSGNESWNPSSWHTVLNLTVADKQEQTFDWPTDPYGDSPSIIVGHSLHPSESITGGIGALEYRSLNDTICTVATNGQVTGVSDGICEVEVRWKGNIEHFATDWHILQSITIEPKKAQNFNWPTEVYGVSPSLKVNQSLSRTESITGGTGGLEFQSEDDEICTVSNNGTVRGVSVGTCQIEARWTGSASVAATNWQVLLNIAVGKGEQSFSWPANLYGSSPSLAVGGELSLRATPSGGEGDLEFRYGGASGCSVDSDTRAVSAPHIGGCIVEIRWGGNDDWSETDWREILNITVAQGTQRLIWPSNPYGASPSLAVGAQGILDLVETIDNGGQGVLEFQSLDETKCTVNGVGQVQGVAVGTCRIQARWTGDDDWQENSLEDIALHYCTPLSERH